MDFSKSNIQKLLKSSIKTKFQDFTPQDFEDFIAQMFRDNSFKVEQTPYSGDFGADVIVEQENKKTAVQVKLFASGNSVGVQDVNQVIGAKEYYNCDKALIITTSYFSTQAKNLAKKTNVLFWDWDKLLNAIGTVYWDGKDYYSYYKDVFFDSNIDQNFSFILRKVAFNELMTDSKYYTHFKFIVANNSNENINTRFPIPPVFVNTSSKQINSKWYYNSFISGKIYSGCTTEIEFLIPAYEVDKITSGEKIVFELNENENNQPNVYFHEFEKSHFPERTNSKTPRRKVDWKGILKVIGKVLFWIVFGVFWLFIQVFFAALNFKGKK